MPLPSFEPSPHSLSAEQLWQSLQRGESLQLVDVREAQELAIAQLPYPVEHLPLSRSSEWMEEIAGRLSRDRPIVVVCHAGVRSWQFACWLVQTQGFSDVWNLEGGIDSWSVAVDPSVPRY